MMTRSEIRRKYGLKTCCCDCWAHFCCHPCAMCQELRELKSRPLTPWANGADARPPAMRYSFAHQGHAGYSFVPSSPSVGSTPPKTPPEYASKPPKVVEYPDHHL
ncbi:unnamed protein product [Ostreobium quekettii]|uniref:Uncharacterized protein n=1 Tax=Ostreobium quekettii TaxID=121088 RepID=A0A8S1J7Z1_9CHLO|nr:unnamed protein product [Ostreobium quekettii]